MFGINKNGTKHKIGIAMPSFFPSSRVTYDNTQSGLTSTDVQDAIDELVQSGGGSIDIQRPTFTEASTRANIESGETISTLFGKIKKWFSDLSSMFVSKSGDTMTGRLNIASTGSNDWYPLSLKSNFANACYIRLYDKNNTELGAFGCNEANVPYFRDGNGVLHVLSMRKVTTLVNESVTIAVNATKTYSALTLSALQAYDELTFMFADGNVLFNGSLTKAQLNMIAGISSGKMYVFGGQVVSSGSVLLDYKCKVYANASGLSILNQSLSSSIDKVLIEGITY